MKKIVILIFICLIIFIIYRVNYKKEKITFSIGSDRGDIVYEKENARITDIIIAIESNQRVSDYDFQYILVKATTIKLTISKFLVLNNYSGVNSQIKDLEKLLVLIKKYNKEKIIIELISEETELADYINKKISILCYKYDIMVKR